jgi:hypothetical protein
MINKQLLIAARSMFLKYLGGVTLSHKHLYLLDLSSKEQGLLKRITEDYSKDQVTANFVFPLICKDNYCSVSDISDTIQREILSSELVNFIVDVRRIAQDLINKQPDYGIIEVVDMYNESNTTYMNILLDALQQFNLQARFDFVWVSKKILFWREDIALTVAHKIEMFLAIYSKFERLNIKSHDSGFHSSKEAVRRDWLLGIYAANILGPNGCNLLSYTDLQGMVFENNKVAQHLLFSNANKRMLRVFKPRSSLPEKKIAEEYFSDVGFLKTYLRNRRIKGEVLEEINEDFYYGPSSILAQKVMKEMDVPNCEILQSNLEILVVMLKNTSRHERHEHFLALMTRMLQEFMPYSSRDWLVSFHRDLTEIADKDHSVLRNGYIDLLQSIEGNYYKKTGRSIPMPSPGHHDGADIKATLKHVLG